LFSLELDYGSLAGRWAASGTQRPDTEPGRWRQADMCVTSRHVCACVRMHVCMHQHIYLCTRLCVSTRGDLSVRWHILRSKCHLKYRDLIMRARKVYTACVAPHRLVSFSSARRCAREVFVEEGSASQLPARLYRYPPPHLTRMYPPPHF
jgi:hypothetical protein